MWNPQLFFYEKYVAQNVKGSMCTNSDKILNIGTYSHESIQQTE